MSKLKLFLPPFDTITPSTMPPSPSPSPSSSPQPTPKLLPSPFPRDSTEGERPTAAPPAQLATASVGSLSHRSRYNNAEDPDADVVDDEYPSLDATENAGASLLPPPSFRPLFTLISDRRTNESYHPSVYYVFADDADNDREGNDVSTMAALRALEQTDLTARTPSGRRAGELADDDDDGEDDDVDERFVFVDLAPGGDPESGTVLKVVSASSLSPAWAVASASLRSAPTFDDNTDDENEGMMLMVEGLELSSSSQAQVAGRKKSSKLKKEEAERKAADLLEEARKRGGGLVEGMVELSKGFGESLEMLENILGEGEGNESKA
jgi:hypothetical protein